MNDPIASPVDELDEALETGDYGRACQIYADHGWKIAEQDLDAGCFYLSFAYVYALEAEHPQLNKLEKFLKFHNRL